MLSRSSGLVGTLSAFVVALMLLTAAPARDAQAQVNGGPNTLILYDYLPTVQYGKLGQIYAIMLNNLLGHFTTNVTLQPIQNYMAGAVNSYDATFYIGSYYDNSPPAAFLSDVKTTTHIVVWFKDNIWKIAWDGTPDFTDRYGIAFDGLAGMNAPATNTNPTPGFYDTVLYKNKSFPKYYRYDGTTIFADPEAGITHVADTSKAQTLVPIQNSVTGQQIPYMIRSGNFWYVADIPFSYIGPRDRYLVFSDLLYDVFGWTPTSLTPRGLVRLEDVSAMTTSTSLNKLGTYLQGQGVPFSIALIPWYRDPLGHYNGGVDQEIHITDSGASALRTALTTALSRGGKIVMHGYTHQWASTPNPYFAVSAEDFEFWNIINNRPIDGDSIAWASGRLSAGLGEISSPNGGVFKPYAWEVPHYQASAVDYCAFAADPLFRKTYQRAVYYTTSSSDRCANPDLSGGDLAAGQFFPYIIERDYYGQRVIPENLGNVEYDVSACDPESNVVYTADDILTNADYAKVVRDGFGSFFFHPYWVDSGVCSTLPNGTGLADFKKIIQNMKAMGYTTWPDPTSL